MFVVQTAPCSRSRVKNDVLLFAVNLQERTQSQTTKSRLTWFKQVNLVRDIAIKCIHFILGNSVLFFSNKIFSVVMNFFLVMLPFFGKTWTVYHLHKERLTSNLFNILARCGDIIKSAWPWNSLNSSGLIFCEIVTDIYLWHFYANTSKLHLQKNGHFRVTARNISVQIPRGYFSP